MHIAVSFHLLYGYLLVSQSHLLVTNTSWTFKGWMVRLVHQLVNVVSRGTQGSILGLFLFMQGLP